MSCPYLLDPGKETHRRGLAKLPGVPIDDWIRDRHMGDAVKPTVTEVAPAALPPLVRTAIETLLDPHSLQSVGLELYRQRLRSITTRHVLLDKAHVEALMGMLAAGAPRPGQLPSTPVEGLER